MAKKRKYLEDYEEEDESEENAKQINVKELINSATNHGFSRLLQNHPKFKDAEPLLIEHLDRERLAQKEKEIYERLREKGPLTQDDIKYIYDEMSNYVAWGLAGDPLAQSLLVGKGLEDRLEESSWKKLRRNLYNLSYEEENFQNTLDAYQDLSHLDAAGHFNEMPEVHNALKKGKSAGSIYMAANVLRYHDKISPSDHRYLMEKAEDMAEAELKNIKSGLEKHVSEKYQKAAGFILLITGIFMLIYSGVGMTGNVIGSLLDSTFTNIIAIIIFILGMILMIKKRKK